MGCYTEFFVEELYADGYQYTGGAVLGKAV